MPEQQKIFLIIGGYGGVGRVMTELLLKETKSKIIVAGRNREAAEKLVDKLSITFGRDRISTRVVDAKNEQSVREGMKDVDFVITATPTPEAVLSIAKIAVEMGIDGLDIMVSTSVLASLKTIEKEIVNRGRTYITQAGFHPGLAAPLIRDGARFFDHYNKANIGIAMNAEFTSAESAREIYTLLDEFEKTKIFKDGVWKIEGYHTSRMINFGPPANTQLGMPMPLAEIDPLPKELGLQETGVFVTGFNWFVNWFVFPLILIANKIKKGLGEKPLLSLFVWGIKVFSPQNQYVIFLLDAEGEKDGKKKKMKITVTHEDPYIFTAAPVVACLLQYLKGTVSPGLHLMGLVVNPRQLFIDCERMGMKIAVVEE